MTVKNEQESRTRNNETGKRGKNSQITILCRLYLICELATRDQIPREMVK